MPTKAILPYAGINVLGSFSLAGFQVTIIGRIWVTAEAKRFLAALFTAFPDIHITVEDVVCEGDKVVVRNIWRATDTGGFAGMSPTRKRVVIEGIVMWRIENGKLAERWAVIDYRSLMRQLSTTSQSK